MRRNMEKTLLIKYLEGNCTAEELQQVAHYLANAEYPDTLDKLLEEEWMKFDAPDVDNDELAQRLLNKFNDKIDLKD